MHNIWSLKKSSTVILLLKLRKSAHNHLTDLSEKTAALLSGNKSFHRSALPLIRQPAPPPTSWQPRFSPTLEFSFTLNKSWPIHQQLWLAEEKIKTFVSLRSIIVIVLWGVLCALGWRALWEFVFHSFQRNASTDWQTDCRLAFHSRSIEQQKQETDRTRRHAWWCQ